MNQDNFFIMKNGLQFDTDKELFFNTQDVSIIPSESTILDVLVTLGVFPSKGQAKKNWKGEVRIPEGFSAIEGIGKLKINVFILNAVCEPGCIHSYI